MSTNQYRLMILLARPIKMYRKIENSVRSVFFFSVAYIMIGVFTIFYTVTDGRTASGRSSYILYVHCDHLKSTRKGESEWFCNPCTRFSFKARESKPIF